MRLFDHVWTATEMAEANVRNPSYLIDLRIKAILTVFQSLISLFPGSNRVESVPGQVTSEAPVSMSHTPAFQVFYRAFGGSKVKIIPYY